MLKRGPRNLQRKPSEYLRHIWLDVVSPLPEAIAFARDLIGADRLLFASDHPWVQPSVILEAMSGADLTAEEMTKIGSLNARKLFALG